MPKSLERLFRPRTIAVFGGKEAARVLEQCDRMGFEGEIWPVHPTLEEVHGRRCFRSIADLPGAPDAAFVGVNRTLTVDIVRGLAERGAGGAVCYASGFREADPTGEGAALEDALVRAAGDMAILGPNCYGLINYLDGALLWPDQHGGVRNERGVAIVTQSSNMAINMTMQRRALPIAYVATAGNQAQTGLSEIAEGLLADPRVSAIGLHIEGIDDVARFEAMARRARELGKPVVAMTVGRSEQAQAATVSHTASVAGTEAAKGAFFARLGIPRLRSIPEFLETLKLLHVHGPLPGGDLCSMSCSGGEASVMADAAVGRRVRYRPLTEAERARVAATLNDFVAIANPLDYQTFVWGNVEAMTATFSAMIGCGFDLSMLVLDFPRSDRCSDADWDVGIRAIKAAATRTGGRTAVVASLPENLPENYAADFLAAGIAPLCGIEEALAAAEAAVFIGARWREPAPLPILAGLNARSRRSPPGAEPTSLPHAEVRAKRASKHAQSASSAPWSLLRGRPDYVGPAPQDEEGGDAERPQSRILDEAEAKALLSSFGVEVPRGAVVDAPAQAVEAAEAFGYPVVVKALGIAHKSEAGAVRLNLRTAAEVEHAAEALVALGNGLLVEAMVTDAVAELLIGVTRDPQFGFLLTIGAGGVVVELLRDSVSLLLPASEDEVRRAILSLKTAPLLQGYRGRPRGDVDAAVAAALAVARFAEANADVLEELDVNPLLVRPQGKGALAADALIRMRDA